VLPGLGVTDDQVALVEAQIMAPESLLESLKAQFCRVAGEMPVDHADTAVPQPDEMAGGGESPRPVRNLDRVEIDMHMVDEDHRQMGGDKFLRIALHDTKRDDQHPVAAAFA